MMRDLREWYQKKFEMIGYRSDAKISVLADFIQQQYVLSSIGLCLISTVLQDFSYFMLAIFFERQGPKSALFCLLC